MSVCSGQRGGDRYFRWNGQHERHPHKTAKEERPLKGTPYELSPFPSWSMRCSLSLWILVCAVRTGKPFSLVRREKPQSLRQHHPDCGERRRNTLPPRSPEPGRALIGEVGGWIPA